MKILTTLTTLIICYLVYGVYLSFTEIEVVPSNLKKENPEGFYDYRGVSNVRSNLSNGLSDPLEIIRDAKTAGLDFLILTDLNHKNSMDNISGYNGSLLVFNEGEYPFLDSRLLYFSLDKNKSPPASPQTSVFFADVLSQQRDQSRDDMLVLAHPFNPEATWTGAYPPGLDGIEVLNPRAIAQKAWRRSKLSVVWSFICYPFNPKTSFLRLFVEPREELALWDKLNEERKVIGMSGSDANARAVPLADLLIKFPSYIRNFAITNNHVLLTSELTGQVQKDRAKIFSALRNGNFYLSMDLLGDPKGFIATIDDRDKQHLMGSSLRLSKGLVLNVKLPSRPTEFFEILIVRNGETVQLSNEAEVSYKIDSPGSYRVVVRVSPSLPLPDGKKWITWILTNPFRVE